MPNLSSLVSQSSRLVTTNSEVTLTNKTIDSPVITVNGQSGNPRQPLVFDDNGSVTFGNGDSFSIPAGGTAGRPAAPETGELRYNTDTSGLEQYNGTEWISVGKTDQEVRDLLSASGDLNYDSSTGEFTLLSPIGVDNGGTGKATLSEGSVLLGDGVLPFQEVAPGAPGNVLTSNGTAWESQELNVSQDFTLIDSLSFDGTNPVEFTNLPDFTHYVAVFSNISGDDYFNMQFGYGSSTVTWITSGYSYIVQTTDVSNNTFSSSFENGAASRIAETRTDDDVFTGEIKIIKSSTPFGDTFFSNTGTGFKQQTTTGGGAIDFNSYETTRIGGSLFSPVSDFTAIRFGDGGFYSSSLTGGSRMLSGTVYLYGLN